MFAIDCFLEFLKTFDHIFFKVACFLIASLYTLLSNNMWYLKCLLNYFEQPLPVFS